MGVSLGLREEQNSNVANAVAEVRQGFSVVAADSGDR